MPPDSASSSQRTWVATWTASPQPVWPANFPVPIGLPRQLWKQTLRQTARISIGGERVRIVLSNAYGDQPLVVGAAELALARSPAAIVDGTSHALRFDGQRGTVVPPGAIAISDPLEWPVAALASLAISLYLPEITPTATLHFDARQTACIAAGDVVSQAELTTEASFTSRLFLSAVWVEAPAAARAVVVLGDSIADGDGSTPDANRRWPDVLAERLLAAGGGAHGSTEPRHFGVPRAGRWHGSQCIGAVRPGCARAARCGHAGLDAGPERHRLAGWRA